MEVSFSSSFKRAFKKRIKGNPDLESRFWQKLEQFTITYGTLRERTIRANFKNT